MLPVFPALLHAIAVILHSDDSNLSVDGKRLIAVLIELIETASFRLKLDNKIPD